MVNAMIVFPLAVAAFGLWELVTGRPLYAAASWPLGRRGTRWGGAYTFASGLVVTVLAATYPSGIAFMTFAILALALAATVLVVRLRRART